MVSHLPKEEAQEYDLVVYGGRQGGVILTIYHREMDCPKRSSLK